MINVFFGTENPFGDIIGDCIKDCIVNIQGGKSPNLYDQMREIAEDVEFEEIETTDEGRKTKDAFQINKTDVDVNF